MTILPSTYRITSVLKIETDIIVSISVSPIGQSVILMVINAETYKTDIIVLMCLMSH